MLDKLNIPTSLKVLIITAGSYAAAYLFQFSYLRSFGIDSMAIEINIPILVASLVSIGFVLIALDFLAEPYRNLTSKLKNEKPIHRYLANLLYKVTIITFILLAVYSLGYSLILATLMFSFLMILEIIGPLFYLRKNSTLEAAIASTQKKHDARIHADRTYLMKHPAATIVAAFLVVITLLAGRLTAEQTTNHYVLNENDSIKTLVIQVHTDTLITKRYNSKEHRWENGYSITQMPATLVLDKKFDTSK
jgi:hypothetical protein